MLEGGQLRADALLSVEEERSLKSVAFSSATRHLAIALLIASTSARAEEARPEPTPVQVTLGSRIRFTESGHHDRVFRGGRVVGTVTDATAEALIVSRDDGSTLSVPRSTPGRLEVSVRRDPKILRGMLRGALVASAAVAVIAGVGTSGYALGPSSEPQMSMTAFTVRVVAVGAAVGALVQPDQTWVRASLKEAATSDVKSDSSTVQVRPMVDFRRGGIGLRFRFGW